MEEKLVRIEIIPFRSFKEKMSITKKYAGKAKVEIHKNIIYIERVE